MTIEHESQNSAAHDTGDPLAWYYYEDELSDEIALDIRGHRHVNREDNADGVYWAQDHTGSSYMYFPAPGKASANALRNFLQGHLPHELITDEYACITPIAQIADNHLLMLQARLWLADPDSYAKTQSDPTTTQIQTQSCGRSVPSRFEGMSLPPYNAPVPDETLLVARHVMFIIDLLHSNHIFVLHKTSMSSCEMPNCLTRSNKQPFTSSIVTIEPLIHWGTVTPVIDVILCHGRVLAFKRDGKSCDDPLWTLAVKRFTPQHPTSYCTECLEMLMDKRDAWRSVERPKEPSFKAMNARPIHMPGMRLSQQYISHETINTNQDAFQHTNTFKNPAGTFEHWESSDHPNIQSLVSPLSLDGACDFVPAAKDDMTENTKETCSFQDSNAHLGTKPLRFYKDANSLKNVLSNLTAEGTSELCTSFTPSSTMYSGVSSSCSYIKTSTSREDHQTPSVPSSPSTARVYFSPDTQPSFVQEYPRFDLRTDIPGNQKNDIRIGAIASSRRIVKREFGREIDTNAAIGSLKESSSTQLGTAMFKKNVAERRTFLFSPIKTIPRQSTQEARTQQQTAPSSASKSDSNWETTSASEEHQSITPKASTPSRKVKALSRIKPSPKLKTARFASTTKSKNPNSVFTPFFAKRTPPNPNTISPQTYTAHFSRIPSFTETICTCRKSALTPTVKLAQCSNDLCTIVWFHYDCLDKSSKISARHGKLTCQICRNEVFFREFDTKMGKENKKEMRMEPWKGEEMLAHMPGLGGGFGVVQPYGIGAVIEEADESVTQWGKGALGELAFLGYVESAPWMVREAYVRARACGGVTAADGEDHGEYGGEKE